MKLLVILLCLLSERFLMHSLSYTRFMWLSDYYTLITQHIKDKPFFANPWMELAALVLIILLPVLVIYYLLYNFLFGFLGFLFNLFLFYYCLGPQNIFYPSYEGKDVSPNDKAGDYFIKANTEVFALIFWYVLTGPLIALAYRLITLFRGFESVGQVATQLTVILEWIPTRITAVLFLFVGNFQRGFTVLKEYLLAAPEMNDTLLSQCGLQAVKADETEEVPMTLAQNLVEYALVIFLVLIAIFTMTAWLS